MSNQSKRNKARLLSAVALAGGSSYVVFGLASHADAQAINVQLSSSTFDNPSDPDQAGNYFVYDGNVNGEMGTVAIPVVNSATANYDAADTLDSGTIWNSILAPTSSLAVTNNTGSNQTFPVAQNLALVNSLGQPSGVSISSILFLENNGKNDTIHETGIVNGTNPGSDGLSSNPTQLMNQSWFDNGTIERMIFNISGLNAGGFYNLYVYGAGQNVGYGGNYVLATPNQEGGTVPSSVATEPTTANIYRSVFDSTGSNPTPEEGLSWNLLPFVADSSGDLSFSVQFDPTSKVKGSINGFQIDSGISPIVPAGNWIAGSSANTLWSTQSNWSSGFSSSSGSAGIVPNNVGATASFTSLSSQNFVTVDSNFTLGGISINSGAAYTIAALQTASGTLAGIGSLTLDNGGTSTAAFINVAQTIHLISAPLILGSNVTITPASGDLVITGNITSEAGRTTGITVNGPTSSSVFVTLEGSDSYTGATNIGTGGLLKVQSLNAIPVGSQIINNGQLSIQKGSLASGTVAAAPVITGAITGTGTLVIGTNSAAFLQIAPNSGASTQSLVSIQTTSGTTLESALDLTNNKLVINYAAATDPVTSIYSLLQTGAAFSGTQDTWTGLGIMSSTAAAANGKFAVGYLDSDTPSDETTNHVLPANQIIVMYTLAGDAFLENSVGFDDLLSVAQHYGNATGMDWAEGCFDYTGSVGFGDLLNVAQNYGTTFTGESVQNGGGGVLQLAWQSSGAQVSAVPEPGSIALVGVAAGLMARRKRRQSKA